MSEWSKVQTIPEGMTILPYVDKPNDEWVLRTEADQRIAELEANQHIAKLKAIIIELETLAQNRFEMLLKQGEIITDLRIERDNYKRLLSEYNEQIVTQEVSNLHKT